MNRFSSGVLSARQAMLLNEIVDRLDRLDRLDATGPLSMTMIAGTPVIDAGRIRDALTPGLHAWKQPVRAATTGAITITAPGSSIDGVVLSVGDRVLVKDQGDATANGIYEFNGSIYPLTRTPDAFDGPFLLSATVTVTEGTSNADSQWRCTANAPITLGTTALPWINSCCIDGPDSPVENSVPTYTSSGNLAAPNNVFIIPGTNAGDPNNTFTISTSSTPASSPNATFRVNVDDGTGSPNFVFNFYPAGTGSSANYTFTTSAAQTSANVTFANSGNPISINTTFTNPSANSVNHLFGNVATGTGISTNFTFDPATQKIQSIEPNFTVDNGAGGTTTGSIAITQAAGVIIATGTNVTLAGSLAGGGSGPAWVKVTKGAANLSAAATSNDIEVYSLPAKGVIHAVVLKHTQQFSGGAISGYNLTVGITGSLNKYIISTIVSSVPSDTVFSVQSSGTTRINVEHFGAATSVRLGATSTGANLDAATQGSADVYLLVSTLP